VTFVMVVVGPEASEFPGWCGSWVGDTLFLRYRAFALFSEEKFGSRGQALDLMRREESGIDLVIIDYALPDMTGAEFAELVRTNWPAMPIIFATRLADASLRQVWKPFRDDELSKAIARVTPVTSAR
jgi:two-component SAPR family response regulator